MAAFFGALAPANASTCSVPYNASNGISLGLPAQPSQINANFASLLFCGNNIDNTNVGAAGFFATQIVPTTVGQAVFGGSYPYTFPNGLTSGGAATISGTLNGAGAVFSGNLSAANLTTPGTVGATGAVQGRYISSNYSNNQGLYYGGGGNVSQLDYNISNANRWTLSSPLSVSGAVAAAGPITSTSSIAATTFVQGNYISSNYSNNQGLFYGGGGNTSALDYNISNADKWTFTSPLVVNGPARAQTGSFNSQMLPYLYAGGAVTTQTHAHIEQNVATVGGGGSIIIGFADPFDTVPICIGRYGNGLMLDGTLVATTSGFTLSGAANGNPFTWVCIGQ